MRKCIVLAMALLTLPGWIYADIPKSRTLDFDYEVIVQDVPPEATELKIWVPILPETEYQIIDEMSVEPSAMARIAEDKFYKNRILNFSLKEPLDSSFQINVHYKLKRLEYSNKPGGSSRNRTQISDSEELNRFLKADRLVTLSPRVRQLAAAITAGEKTTLQKAMAIYDYIFKNVTYDKTIPGWGQGDTERVCRIKAGNCTDFHSFFISLARASGIPAKFIIGVSLEPDQRQGWTDKYHCWAEFFDKKRGWIPVDISEAWQDKSKYEYYFGTIGKDRLEFAQGRDIVLEPPQAGAPLNYFVYPYVEVDGKVFKKVAVAFRFQDRS